MREMLMKFLVVAFALLLWCASGHAREGVEKAGKVLKAVTGGKAAPAKKDTPAGKAPGGRAGGMEKSKPEKKADTTEEKKPEEEIKKVTGVGTAKGSAKKVVAAAAPVPVVEEVFVLPDLGWRDVFTDPRDAERPTVEDENDLLGLAAKTKKVWDDGIAALTLEAIIGIEDNLTAVIAGKKVKSGYTVTAEKLKFRIEKITADAVHFICISKGKEYEELRDLKVRRRIGF